MPNFSGVWNLKEQIQAIAAGRWTGLPLYELYAWGSNGDGQLGINASPFGNNRSSPVQVGNLKDWAAVGSGDGSHVMATKVDGTLWTWGVNSSGMLGLGDTVNRLSPVQVGSLTAWGQVAPSAASSFALRQDGTLWAWGSNSNGYLGDNTTVSKSSPVQIGSETDWVYLSAGAAIKATGALWSWGRNGDGQIGDNTTITRSSPVQVGILTNWAKIHKSSSISGAIKTDNTLWMWGDNQFFGRLGDGTTISRSSPVQIGALTNWSKVITGDRAVALKTDGTLWAWGRNDEGSLGDNTSNISKSSPVQIGSLTDWSDIAASGSFALATKLNGTLWAWGKNGQGQLGDNTIQPRSSPTQVGALTTWALPGNASSTAFAFIQSQSS